VKTKRDTGFRPYIGQTFLIGLGFFTMGLMDPLYDSYVPLLLRDYIASKGLIGTVMTLDNIFALFLIPLVAAMSDRARTPLGRRIPFILATLPITGLLFGSVPFAATVSLPVLVATLFMLNVFKQSARGPVVALMPDIIPGEYRSEANGVINTMGGIAAIVGLVGLAKLMDVSVVLPVIGDSARKLPFLIAGVLVILATLALFFFVRERQRAKEEEERPPLFESFRMIAAGHDKSAVFILVAIFLWFFGYQGLLPFVTMYTIEVYGVTEGTAGLFLGMVGISYALFAIPSGYVAHRFGRKRTIRVSLAALAVMSLAIFATPSIGSAVGIPITVLRFVYAGELIVFGIFWATVITNSFPMLWQMATYDNVGIYTGLYYTFSQAAAILSPPVGGVAIDAFGFGGMFLFTLTSMVLANVAMAFVRSGETGGTSEAEAEL
jgi:maltose/moltooligosaccharide transporter